MGEGSVDVRNGMKRERDGERDLVEGKGLTFSSK